MTRRKRGAIDYAPRAATVPLFETLPMSPSASDGKKRLADRFIDRHVGPRDQEIGDMLAAVGYGTIDALVADTVPVGIRHSDPLGLPAARSEDEVIEALRRMAAQNVVSRCFIGMGYHGTITPPVILRNVLEDPGWYTQYTPYQAEIAQGRLEALLNFQTMVMDLAGMEVANASLLDEGTAAAEAMTMAHGAARGNRNVLLVAADCHPQTIAVVRTRAEPQGVQVVVSEVEAFAFTDAVFGVLVSYPATDGHIRDYAALCREAHAAGAMVIVVADLLSLCLLQPPGEFGADVVVGSSQRFGVPMGFGGPHAAFFAARDAHKRKLPGRIIGVSVDSNGDPALRMALQTREQHIRREKATSNICTAQVLLAVMASMYAVYHGPEGLRRIAERVHGHARRLADGLERSGHALVHRDFFDTLRIRPSGRSAAEVFAEAERRTMVLRLFDDGTLGVSLDEVTTDKDVDGLLAAFGGMTTTPESANGSDPGFGIPEALKRTSSYLEHPVFNRYHSETEMVRYLTRLRNKDLSLVHAMIPLGSCTMKLNAAAEMIPVTFPGFGSLHPFAPRAHAAGYARIFEELEQWLAEITGLPAVSLQPNSGAQGEYTGLLVIRAYHRSRGNEGRTVCLIPTSAHGTNPASAVMAGFDVVLVSCDERGNTDMEDLRRKVEQAGDRLSALMITYPSTHGVFEEQVTALCDIVHAGGGLVYMDGANMNAQVGLCRPGDIGADVCHLNLHKTFSIPHGGGGPGMGPIAVSEALAPFLPGHPVVPTGGDQAIGPVSAAPWGSASILPISWAYLALLGADGVRRATELAILNANYMARRLEDHYPILYRGERGRVAHEFIIDLREIKRLSGIGEEDIAKRLMDYGFHAPTMSWPVPGTMMVEPTESESLAEMDRFCDALIAIREEIREVEAGIADPEDNVLKHAPHTAAVVTADAWDRPYSRSRAAYPASGQRDFKFWPSVGRVDNAHGDRNLVCACLPVEAYAE